MPRKYTSSYRRRYKKKTGYTNYRKGAYKAFEHKFKQRGTTQVMLYRGLQQVFPDILRTTIRNSCGVNWLGTAGATEAYAIGGNLLHNPLSAGPISGAFPITAGTATTIYGLGNILSVDSVISASAPYLQYRILGSKIKAQTQITNIVSVNVGANMCLLAADGNTIPNFGNVNTLTLGEMKEMPYSKSTAVTNTKDKGVIVYHSMRTCKMAGLKNESSCEEGVYAGSQGTNPIFTWYWVATWHPTSSGNTPATTTFQVDYDIEFFNRNALASTNG